MPPRREAIVCVLPVWSNPPVDTVRTWGVRAGGFLAMAAASLPQRRIAGDDVTAVETLGILPSGFFRFAQAAWLLAPSAVAILIVLASLPRLPGRSVLRGALPVVFLAAAVAMATQGSILMTPNLSHPAAGSPTFALSFLVFLVPILTGSVVLARLLGDADRERTVAIAQASLGLMLLLNGLFLIDSWWDLFATGLGGGGAGEILLGSWAAPLGGGLIAVASLIGPSSQSPGAEAPGDPGIRGA